MALHCTECGFVNDEGANYCQRCGAPLARAEVTQHGPALVIRAGGGRVGESFAVEGERMSIGRRPDSEVFLDDVTVSRDHALLIRRADDWYLDDCGSLNGTYVNRSRIESQRLQEGDEVQVGKYKLTFHAR
jgi:pSer/pThr/pTyr-binding forkhead associated (FHA) protein